MSNGPIPCVASLIAPLHLIGLMSAVRHYHGDRGAALQIFVNWPGGERRTIEKVTAAIRDMARAFPEIASVTPVFNEDLTELAKDRPDYGDRAGAFSADYGVTPFCEIYYPFDLVGEVYPLLAMANPSARRICIGENLGHLFDRELYFSMLPPAVPAAAPPSPARILRSKLGGAWRGMKRYLGSGPAVRPPPRFPPSEAALLLPIDQSAGLLDRIPLTVPDRRLAQEIAFAATDACTALDSYCHDLLRRHTEEPRYILCTQNFAEAKFILFEREIAMWVSIVRQHCPVGATIFHKPHPAETLPRGAAIEAALGADYHWVELDPAFGRFPIEIWRTLVTAAMPISGSNPILTLRYLYGIEGIQPFDPALIEQWFPPEMGRFMRNAVRLFAEPLRAYPSWDGKSVLWTAPDPS